MIATECRIYMNDWMHWTLEATCSACGRVTVTVLIMGVPHCCSGCGKDIKIDPAATLFRRSDGRVPSTLA